MQPGRKQKLVTAVVCRLEFVIESDQTIDLAFYLVGRTVLVNLPVRPGWIVGLRLETALVQLGFKNTTELVDSSVGVLVSSQQLVEFSDVVPGKRSLLPDGCSHELCRLLMILQDFDEIMGIAVRGATIDQICAEALFYEGLGCASVNIVQPFDDSRFNRPATVQSFQKSPVRVRI